MFGAMDQHVQLKCWAVSADQVTQHLALEDGNVAISSPNSYRSHMFYKLMH